MGASGEGQSLVYTRKGAATLQCISLFRRRGVVCCLISRVRNTSAMSARKDCNYFPALLPLSFSLVFLVRMALNKGLAKDMTKVDKLCKLS